MVIENEYCDNNSYSACTSYDKNHSADPVKGSHQKKKTSTNTGASSSKSQKGKSSSNGGDNYGAWGSIYQNRDNFNEMHFC